MWVVKLGGSLGASQRLRGWLRALAWRPDLVLVPGGGPFADQVRAAQARWEFDDSTAHHLAILAMEQFGRVLCAIQAGLVPVGSRTTLRAAVREGATPVWMPTAMTLGEGAIAQSWDVTSDSLAAWLCAELGAGGLLVVKTALPAGLARDPRTLCAQGIVDRAFPQYVQRLQVPVRFLSDEELERLASTLAGPSH
jgi:5-(aminomethyl)-3-furanmethanol phosphate kinase